MRTPLSVISNELACLDSEIHEVSRSRRRCREIVDILDAIPREALRTPIFNQISLVDLDIPAEIPPSTKCVADAKLLQLAFQLFDAVCLNTFEARPTITVHNFSGERLILQAHTNHAPHKPKATQCSSLTEFFCSDLELDAPTAPFIDAIMQAHGIEIESSSTTLTIFRFSIPVVST